MYSCRSSLSAGPWLLVEFYGEKRELPALIEADVSSDEVLFLTVADDASRETVCIVWEKDKYTIESPEYDSLEIYFLDIVRGEVKSGNGRYMAMVYVDNGMRRLVALGVRPGLEELLVDHARETVGKKLYEENVRLD